MAATTKASIGEGELLASDWCEYLRTVSLACSGMTARIRTANASSCAPRMRLRDIHFDEREGLLEVALGGTAAHGPALRCYLHPRGLAVRRSDAGHEIVIDTDGGAETLIEILAGGL